MINYVQSFGQKVNFTLISVIWKNFTKIHGYQPKKFKEKNYKFTELL